MAAGKKATSKKARRSAPDALDKLRAAALADPIAGGAYVENEIRRELAAVFERERQRLGLSLSELGSRAAVSPLTLRRVLHMELGGPLRLGSVVRVMRALGLTMTVRLTRAKQDHVNV